MVPPPASSNIVFTSNTYGTRPGGGLEIFAIEATGAGVTRLTFCNTADRRCDYLESIPGTTRARQAVRRLMDTDGDGRLTATDGESLRIVDLARAVEGELVPGNAHVSGADWSPGEEILYYSGVGQTAADDLYQITSNGQSNQNLTNTTGLRERRPRFNLGGTSLAFERIDTTTGKGQIWIATSLGLRALTTGGDGSAALAGTPYIVGSDADPVFSADGRLVLFRRLMATGNGGLGVWDLMTIRTDVTGATPTTFVTGAAYRGAADWNATGVVFVEVVSGSGPQLVFVDASGGARRVLMTAGAGFEMAFPHWLK
jgi:Tol biopolymer transport system component